MKRIKILENIKNNKNKKINLKYIIKNISFYNEEHKICYPILIPRIQTETLLSIKKMIIIKKKNILDWCSGSGNINLKIFSKNKTTQIDKNYISYIFKKNKNETTFICNLKNFLIKKKNYTLITINPPYVCNKKKMYIDNFKKKQSLQTIFKGLLFFFFFKYINKNIFKNNYILIENGYNQSKKIRNIFKKTGYVNITTIKDLLNLNRITYIEI